MSPKTTEFTPSPVYFINFSVILDSYSSLGACLEIHTSSSGNPSDLRLLLEQDPSHAVHADAVIILGHGREQGGNLILPRCEQLIQRPGAVLSAAP